jgi:hypothetical protein
VPVPSRPVRIRISLLSPWDRAFLETVAVNQLKKFLFLWNSNADRIYNAGLLSTDCTPTLFIYVRSSLMCKPFQLGSSTLYALHNLSQ